MLRPLALCLFLLLLPGCATSGYQRASKTADRTAAYQDQLEKLRSQVGLACEALRALSENPGDSPRSNQETFQTFALELEGLERIAGRTQKLHGKADGGAEAFFGQWSTDTASLTNAELKESAAVRRKALEANYSKLEEGQAGLTAALGQYTRELRELALYLEHDLTAAGMASVRRSIQAAFVNGALLQDQIEAQTALARRAAQDLAPLKALAPEVPPRGAR